MQRIDYRKVGGEGFELLGQLGQLGKNGIGRGTGQMGLHIAIDYSNIRAMQ